MNDVIITNKAFPVNEQSTVSSNTDTEITIQRCPHDQENPYTMVRNELIRDASISPECRWLIIYLLSNKPGWKINIQQLINHLKGHVGRDNVYALVNEALESGYMKREVSKKGNLKQQTKYFVSETPKFKKFFRHPESQDTELRDTENQGYKKDYPPKNDYPEESKSSLKVPAEEGAAKAAEIESKPSQKPKREKPEFPPKAREVGTEMINSLTQAKSDYLPPQNLFPFLSEVDFLLRLDKRAPEKVMDVFNWALSDSFWADKMYKPNPAKYLREKFDQLEMKMNAKPPKNPNERDGRLRDKEGNVVDEWKDRMF